MGMIGELACDMEDVVCAEVSLATGLRNPEGATVSSAILPAAAAPRRVRVQLLKSGGSVKSPLMRTDPAPANITYLVIHSNVRLTGGRLFRNS
jgi:hypothetical protein